jgi:DNA-binding Xre family transcriptional regulator
MGTGKLCDDLSCPISILIKIVQASTEEKQSYRRELADVSHISEADVAKEEFRKVYFIAITRDALLLNN